MIPMIGIMVGCYIVTRMISFLTRKGERQENLVVKISAIFTIIVAVIVMIDLISRGTQAVLP